MLKKSTMVVLSVLMLLLFAGCESDEDPTEPTPSEPGTVEIDAEPDALDAPWDLTGPGNYSGSGAGDSTLSDMTPGTYTISWGAVSGWTAPAGDAKTLTAEGTVTFSGT
jgi:hypothetical protein